MFFTLVKVVILSSIAPTYVVGVRQQFFFLLAQSAEGADKRKLWDNLTKELLQADLDDNHESEDGYHFHDKSRNPLPA